MNRSILIPSLAGALALLCVGCRLQPKSPPPVASSPAASEAPKAVAKDPTDAELQDWTPLQLLSAAIDTKRDGYRARLIKVAGGKLRWSASDIEKVIQREVWIGATMDQVRTAWGHPRRHQTAHYESGDDDTFYYGSLFSSGWTEGN